MKKRLEIAVAAAKKAGQIQLQNFGNDHKKDYKSATDFATEVDYQCELEIINIIREAFPDDGILAEESGKDSGDSEYVWVIDPLDGTVNYAHGLYQFCTIIGLYNKKESQIELGVIYIPVVDELYTAIRGHGAYMNGEKISVSSTPRMKDGFLTLGSFYATYERERDEGNKKLLSQVEINENHRNAFLRVRIMGSAGVDIAHVARGATEAHLCFGTKPWDNIGSAIILEEAGGKVVDNNAGKITLESRGIIGSNNAIFEEFISLIKRKK